MEIYKDLSNPASQEFEKLLSSQLSKIKIEEGVKDLLSKIHYWKNAPVWNPKSIKKATRVWFRLLEKK